jgi:hypothetical protein
MNPQVMAEVALMASMLLTRLRCSMATMIHRTARRPEQH